MIHLKNYADTEDIFQTVFLKYVLSSVAFESREYEKAWFIRVTVNACKDLLKSFFRSRTVSLEEIMEQPAQLSTDDREVLEAVLSLPQKYKDVVYLHYYEGYTAPQISRILGKNKNTVYTLLTRSRQLLREKLGGDEHEKVPEQGAGRRRIKKPYKGFSLSKNKRLFERLCKKGALSATDPCFGLFSVHHAWRTLALFYANSGNQH